MDKRIFKVKFVENVCMAAPLLDKEFMQYWSKLTVIQKESLLSVAKNYVHPKDHSSDIDDQRRNLIQEERERYLRGEGKSYSWDEVRQMATNKDKRNGL